MNGTVSTKYIDDNVLAKGIFEYDKILDLYCNLFGLENVHILFYEDLKKDKVTFLKRLSYILFSDDSKISLEESNETVINRSYASIQIRLARFLNKFFYSHFNRNSLAFNLKIPGTSRRIDIFFLRKILQSHISFSLLGGKKKDYEKISNHIKFHYKSSNDLLRTKYDLLLPEQYF